MIQVTAGPPPPCWDQRQFKVEAAMEYTISARGKPAAVPIQRFIERHYDHIPLEEIDSFFGFVEPTTLYGGRIYKGAELSAPADPSTPS